MKITRCKTNHLTNPLGFDLTPLRLTWTVEDTLSASQTAARVEISPDESFRALIHDSGSDPNINSLCYAPCIELSPRTRYYWRVTVWGDSGDHAASCVNWFETGKMSEDYQGAWISPDLGDKSIHPYLRRKFNITKEVSEARIYITGLGLYELYINGNRVSDEYLAPGCNAYDKWIQASTYDVTNLLCHGENCLGVMLGNGWAKGRFGVRSNINNYCDEFMLLCELRVLYGDGNEIIITSDEQWKCFASPVIDSGIYDGESYDANREIAGWANTELDDSGWKQCKMTNHGLGEVSDRLSPPVRVMQEITPEKIIMTPAGEVVLDMGQNMVGFIRFCVDLQSGEELSLYYGEILQEGCFYRDNLRTAKQAYHYISGGTAAEVRPHFTFYGFRYVKLVGFPDSVRTCDFTGCVLFSDMERTGYIETSDADVNRLFANVVWGQKGNFIDTPTDCPQRDERLGWTGDAQVFGETAAWNMDVYAFFSKYLHDLAQEQKAMGGCVPQVVPDVYPKKTQTSYLGGGTTGWADAAVILPWMLYEFYGDAAILDRQFDSMRAWVDWVAAREAQLEESGLNFAGQHFGDWLSLDAADSISRFGGTEIRFLCLAYFYISALIVSKASVVLKKDKVGHDYQMMAEKVRKTIIFEYFTAAGRLSVRTQTALVIALQMGLYPDGLKEKTLEDLKSVLMRDKFTPKTGLLGTPFLCSVLSENGAHEYACKLFFNRSAPGWLYAVEMGATTIWERWDSVAPNGKMKASEMNSLNHYAYGSIASWMYRYLCGISIDDRKPGFRSFTIRVMPCLELDWAKADLDSPMGRISCGWRKNNDGIVTVNVTIPFGAVADLEFCGRDKPVQLAAGRHEFHCTLEKTESITNVPLGMLLNDKMIGAIIHKKIPILFECHEDVLKLSIIEILKGGYMELFAPKVLLEELIETLRNEETG